MRGDKFIDGPEAIDSCGILDVCALRVLMALAEPHQRLARPWIVVEHRNFHDACRKLKIGVADLRLYVLECVQHLVGVNHVRIETDQIRGVRGANLGNPWDASLLKVTADRHALEEGLQRHSFVYFDEDMLVTAIGITDSAHAYSPSPILHADRRHAVNSRSKKPVSNRPVCTSFNRARRLCSGAVVTRPSISNSSNARRSRASASSRVSA